MSKLILFQGDSITDCGRSRDNDSYLGCGYPLLVKASLGYENPGEYDFINRGISGNRSVDVYARIKADIINLKPDYLSIYMGVNDVWHELGSKNGVATPKFEKIYSMMLEEILEACPNTKIFLIAPFVIKGHGTYNAEDTSYYEAFMLDVQSKIEAVKRVGEKFGLPVIELQPAFDEACKKAPDDYWTADGVHPTPMGHELIKRLWLETFEKIK
ncbi:MAG: SGNH/GDSL hydrolase family protein [Acutalibacteraceae bacterium]|nr:SGNH/GDSL hydrolase family protein [Acutalibacteraceae bacterium]